MKDMGKRQNAFDFIRLLAALSVAVEHSVHHLDARFLWHTQHDSLWFNGGVSTFFILSGMMIYKSAARCSSDGRPWSDFYQNRALRIVPAIYVYFVILVLLLLLTGVIAPGVILSLQMALFAGSNLALAPVWSPPFLDDFGIGVVNGSLWTIPVEVSFYVIVPLIVILARKFGSRIMLVMTLAFAGAGVVVYGAAGATASTALPWKLYGVTFVPYLWWFAIGIAWVFLWPKVRKSGWLALACIVVYFLLEKLPLSTGLSFTVDAVAAIPLSYSVIWFGYFAPSVFGAVASRLGDLSFSAYIWHMIVVNYLVTWGAREWDVDGNVLVLLVLAVTIVLAWLSWHFVERPALRRKRYTSAAAGADAGGSTSGDVPKAARRGSPDV